MNVTILIQIAGGLGLFLMGMVLLTDGLKAVAGRALRDLLARFVGGPVSGLATGAVFTALVQSSSATTLTTIGFVSAGLITFPQAVGVIFGANIGTTSTGWIVSLLGLKVSLGSISPPLVLLGVLLKLFSRERLGAAGLALAGFALIFIGIDALQAGMEGLSDRIGGAILPADEIGGRLALVGIGVVMTVVMQSSSAAVAATLVAMSTGAIDFDQAAALVIGQNIGTTVTAALAAIGASVPARRTAVAHILFNVLTGVIAFAALPLFSRAALGVAAELGGDPGPTSIAAFHTLFNVIGVVVLLPFVRPFSRLVVRLVPSRTVGLTSHLDPTVATLGAVGLEAGREAVRRTLRPLVDVAGRRLGAPPGTGTATARLDEVARAVPEIQDFLGRLAAAPRTTDEIATHLDLLHAADHLDRLHAACHEAVARPARLPAELVGDVVREATEGLALLGGVGEVVADAGLDRALAATSARIADLRRRKRSEILEAVATGGIDVATGNDAIDFIRWTDRVLYHVAHCVHHLVPDDGAGGDAQPPAWSDAPEPRGRDEPAPERAAGAPPAATTPTGSDDGP